MPVLERRKNTESETRGASFLSKALLAECDAEKSLLLRLKDGLERSLAWQSGANQQVLEGFLNVARHELQNRGISLRDHKIQNWRSYEDPSWEQAILHLHVDASAKDALDVWDHLGEKFDKYLESLFLQSAERLRFSLSVEW